MCCGERGWWSQDNAHWICKVCGQHTRPSENFTVLDSGEREEFASGAVRDLQKGKGFWYCLPYHPMKRVVILYENGSYKYDLHNWRLGIPKRVFLNSAMNHLMKCIEHEYDGSFTEEDNAAAVVFNMLGYMQMQRDDMENPAKPEQSPDGVRSDNG